jgi:hypothetical protein
MPLLAIRNGERPITVISIGCNHCISGSLKVDKKVNLSVRSPAEIEVTHCSRGSRIKPTKSFSTWMCNVLVPIGLEDLVLMEA